jgi:amino-acid N-acetyltransferase
LLSSKGQIEIDMNEPVSIRKATAADYPHITRLLTEAALPLDGLDGHDNFLVLCQHTTQGSKTIGCAALERYGRSALLRSVALDAAARGQGLGRRVVQQTLQQARRDGIAEVILLTTTAAPFFERLGFRRIPRDEVPAPVRDSAEFRGACPDTAAVLRLVLK